MSSSQSAAATGGRDSPRRDFQFSLRIVFLVMLALAVVLAIGAQFPKWSVFVLLMTGLTLLPLAVAGGIRKALALARPSPIGEPGPPGAGRPGAFRRPFDAVADFLGFRAAASDVRLRDGAAIACVFMLVIVGLWPLLRELGLVAALVRTWAFEDAMGYAQRGLVPTITRGGYWTRLWQWELWSAARWWLLFGSLALVWLAVSIPCRRNSVAEHTSGGLARLLAFAPWIVVLEMLFLIGVWLQSPTTVPEPSTGFVVGIFSWDLWHWNCWRDRGWLVRGAAPTLLVGALFFRQVLRWPWPLAMIAGACLIRPALTLSVAWTVLWQNGW